MNIAHYSKKIVGSFEKLLFHLNTLCSHIQNELSPLPVWVSHHDVSFMKDRGKVISALMQLQPIDHQLSPQETWACPGAVAGNLKTLRLILKVNNAKDAFRVAAEEGRTVFKANPTKTVRHILLHHGYGCIRLKQVYRHICYTNCALERISWSKGKAYAMTTLTIKEAGEALLKTGRGKHIDVQLKKLNQLKSSSTLVKRRSMKPYWVVNVTGFPNEKGEKFTQKIATSLPIFYLHDKHKPIPTVCFSKKAQRSVHSKRADQLIEDQPFLKSISAYRYKKDRH